MNKFWVVWKISNKQLECAPLRMTSNPTVIHLTEESAITEAKRLALGNPNNQFHVCEVLVKGIATTTNVIYTTFKGE